MQVRDPSWFRNPKKGPMSYDKLQKSIFIVYSTTKCIIRKENLIGNWFRDTITIHEEVFQENTYKEVK